MQHLRRVVWGELTMALETLDLINIVALLTFILFLLVFVLTIISFFRWLRVPFYYDRIPTIRVEDYICPKCGSKELELVGRRTMRCRKCNTTFTIHTSTAEEYLIVWPFWPFFWFFPFIWWVPAKRSS